MAPHCDDEDFAKECSQTTPNLLFQLIADQNEKLDKVNKRLDGLTPQLEFVNRLIAREDKRAAFRDAVIEKTTASLVWAIVVGLGLAIWQYVKDHLK